MDAKIINVNGRTKISVNGEIIEPAGFMTYNPDAGQFEKVRDIGNRICFFGAYACDQGINTLAGLRPFTPHFFIGDDQYDFSEIERTLELIAPGGKGAFIIPRVYLSTPKWWEEKYPEELCRDDRGEAGRECFASKKWRSDFWGALKALIDFVNNSKWRECVIGYHIAAGSTEEWTYHGHKFGTNDYFDYSKPNLDYFKEWLANKYQTIDALNSAWNSKLSSFDDVKIPSPPQRRWAYNGILRDLSREQNVTDFFEYGSWLFADTIIWLSRQVKEYSNNTLLTGAFYGYTTMLSSIDKCHFDLYDVLESPYVDFTATTHGGGAPWPYATAIDSIHLHNKLFISEGDIRTCLTRPLADTLPQIIPDNRYYTREGIWFGPKTVEQSVSNLKRSSARVLTGHSGIWWFDMFGGWFDDPKMYEVIKRHRELSAMQTITPFKAETALIVDENGLKHFKRNEIALRYAIDAQRVQLSLSGAPYHVYLADDLARDDFPVDDYKLYVFVQFCHPTDKVKDAIESKLKRGGRTLLWTYFAGIGNAELTDYNIVYDPAQPDMLCEYAQSEFTTYKSAYEPNNSGEFASYPPTAVPCPRFTDSCGAYKLAKLQGTEEPALLWKQFDDYASVYSLLPAVPYQILREIMYMSSVHVYSITGDALMAGGRFAAIHAITDGEKRIHFPFPVSKVYDAYTDEEVKVNDIFIDFEMKAGETRLFYIDK